MSYFSLIRSQKLSVGGIRLALCMNKLPLSALAYSRKEKFVCPNSREVLEVVEQRIQNQVKLKTVRGIRHLFSLPVNGQRTHSNAGTRKRASRQKRT